jgi:hypothetical protein
MSARKFSFYNSPNENYHKKCVKNLKIEEELNEVYPTIFVHGVQKNDITVIEFNSHLNGLLIKVDLVHLEVGYNSKQDFKQKN